MRRTAGRGPALSSRAVAVRAILFDLFDTLVDLHMEWLPETLVAGRPRRSTWRSLHEVVAREAPVDFDTFARALDLVDRELGAERQARGLELPTVERFGELLRRLGVARATLAEELTRVHMGKLREVARFHEHHAPLLARLRAQARIGLCSNFSHSPTALALLEQGGLREHLDAVAISDEVGFRKPRREIFEEALRRLGVAPGEAVHVGDRLDADVAGAGALGIRPIWLVRRAPEAERQLAAHTGPPPAAVIADLAELPEALAPL